MTALNPQPRAAGGRSRIVICGGGVGAIEALLGLRSLLGLAVQIDLIAPNHRFVYEPLAVAEPFGLARTRRFEIASVAAEYGARLHVASLEAVEPERRWIAIGGDTRLAYDRLIVAVGARRCAWLPGALAFSGAADVAPFRELLAALVRGELKRLAFAVPPGPGWALPTYELALLTASLIAERHMTEIELVVATPESEPMATFGPAASRALRDVLADRGIRLHAGHVAQSVQAGSLLLASGEVLGVDQVVALPRLEGPRVTGLPADELGFIEIDDHAQVVGLADVYAAGDATAFPVKQGGITTQHSDAAVEAIAASLHAGSAPSALAPMLRGMLLTGVAPTYLRAALIDQRPSFAQLAADPLWWPPTKIAGRYLGPYLAQTAPDVVPTPAAGSDPGGEDPRDPLASHEEARELALTFARADANGQDYQSALRWLEVVEALDGRLPPGYPEKRAQWRRQVALTSP
ncbi:MAG: FAD-dependent oxidoreductase [Solirubrobacteraceae bacterium]|jgi:sulfide:quinone oxidoreductase